jgi:transcription-repair coupling factor (superfamily II helicase)
MSRAPPRSPFDPLLPEAASLEWAGLHGGARAIALAQAAARAEAPLLVVTPDTLTAERLEDEICFYLSSPADIPILGFPDWEILPYDQFSPYQEIVSTRLRTLARLPWLVRGIIVVPVATLMHRLAPRRFVESHSFLFKVGERLDRTAFRERLVMAGYSHVAQVLEHGDFAVRGSLIDVFPMGSPRPFRLDFLDDEIDSIREFDPETQRSLGEAGELDVLPAREFPLDAEAVARFRSGWRRLFPENPRHCPVYEDVAAGIAPAGIEYYLPLFFEHTDTLFDYLRAGSLVVLDEGVEERAERFWRDTAERHERMNVDATRPLLEPAVLFLSPAALERKLDGFRRVTLRAFAQEDAPRSVVYASCAPVSIPVDVRAREPLAALRRFLDTAAERALIVAETAGRRETLLELLRGNGASPSLTGGWGEFLAGGAKLALTVAPLEEGAHLLEPSLAVIAEPQLFGERVSQRRRRRRPQRDAEAIIADLTDLAIGAPVVHDRHGVGRYRGLVELTVNDVQSAFICVEYADGDKLYVPVASLHLISRYTGMSPEHAPLHKLGSGQWERARERAAKRIRDVAAELLGIHARRQARSGHAFTIDRGAYQAFTVAFPFEETPDQETAIEAVLGDMQHPRPMDRLVCGDSGFGKTEVAMRAAFVAVMDGRQVAVLVPTTLLAQQHYENFVDRFADWPVQVAHLSRFRTAAEQAAIVESIDRGAIDIVIGTHKLLSRQIRFKRLGLLVIDEEHRFGVRQKERLKALRAEVDILTLTATPIPRTLNLALAGVRELSLIATPPARRLAVKTFVRRWSAELLREAMLREINRGGQVYFVHNEIETIEAMAAQLEALVPEARVRFAHGQMRERVLEQVMSDFYHRRFNVLVCTTIIETGIDVPSANTLIVNRADRFGLAQLYQLRGRVGRSHHRAYAFLLVPERREMTADAVKRLEAIESLEALGIGFTLATHDLEIRGAGEILGEEQSGHIDAIGFALYTELLNRAVGSLKAGAEPDLIGPMHEGIEIDLRVPALITEDYLPDVHTRLVFYKRIAGAQSHEALELLREEMIDRFGVLPEATGNLFRIQQLRLEASMLGVKRIDLGPHGGRILFEERPKVDPLKVVKLIQQHPDRYRLEGNEKLGIRREFATAEDRFEELSRLLRRLAMKDAA